MGLNKAIFFDRDGVLNAACIHEGLAYPPRTLQEVVIPADAVYVTTHLKLLGFYLIGITNQPDVARGKTSKESVEAINLYIKNKLLLDVIYTCYHDTVDQCFCRKPKPGMLWTAAEDYGIDLNRSVLIGDRWRDIEAALAARCKAIWLKPATLYQEKLPQDPDFIATSLTQAYSWIKLHLLEQS